MWIFIFFCKKLLLKKEVYHSSWPLMLCHSTAKGEYNNVQ